MGKISKKIYVAMSGGVDSSVAAALLVKQGYTVHGFFMQGWNNPHFECQWENDRRDASRVCAKLGMPFKVLDFSNEYHAEVVSYLIREYMKNKTPNPDVACNKEIKFGLFLDWALKNKADYIATGHYVIKSKFINTKSKINYKLLISKDKNKDQSYFLWTLTQKELGHCLFPIGEHKKDEVREIAKKYNLHIADKKDSQGICFVGKGNIGDFLKEYIKPKKGSIITSDGKKIGEHDGLEYFTIGQRHGIGYKGGEGTYYVSGKNYDKNELIVSKGENNPELFRKDIEYKNANWINPIKFPLNCEARIRYRQALTKCTVTANKVVFEKPVKAVAPGQSVVFYRKNEMLGGAIIE